ncbi:MAG: diguanylate cyclase [Anaerolineales bacterium]|nr:diguanylate cyclase [Anaerolineales bacterium]
MSTDNSPLDQLTGLITRKGFEEKLKAAVLHAQQTDRPLALAFLDIDHFKRLNDSLGHEAGDVIIKAVGDIVQRVAGDKAIVCRYGGEEYTLIFPDTEREQAFLVIESARSEIAQLKSLSDGKKKVNAQLTISGGIAAFPIDGQDENELLRKADQALYKAKNNGRNKIVLAYEEKMSPKTSHYTLTQLERLSELAKEQGVGEAVLLREALDNLLVKYKHAFASKK